MSPERDPVALREVANPGRRFSLLVAKDGMFANYPLPDAGEVVIGRAEECGVQIDHPAISRRHAVLRASDRLVVEDLGSANGTRVNGAKLAPRQPRELSPGDQIELGPVVLAVQLRPATRRLRRLLTHGEFEALLEEECARASRSGPPFAVARIHLSQAPREAVVIHALLLDSLRPADRLASYGPADYELLLPQAGASEARSLLDGVAMRLARQAVQAGVGLAVWPQDGRSPEELIARAGEGLSGGGAESTPGEPVAPVDPAMLRLLDLADRVAASDISVLILGETGVGKEVLAERLHKRSPRAEQPMLRLNCASLSSTLIESELFGYERGAFTGANTAKPGLLETAQGGTVFLDEIGDLDPGLQAKLLRLLEERKVLRVGGLKARDVDVRFVAATLHDLEDDVRRGTFRRDLYYRLAGVTLVVPPLRERTGDVARLAQAFVAAACHKVHRRPVPRFSEEALELLRAYAWPGNVRELRNCSERAVLLCSGSLITPEHLPAEKMRMPLAEEDLLPVGAPAAPQPVLQRPAATLGAQREAQERRLIEEALSRCQGNQSKAAEELGMARRTLVRRLETFGLPRPRKK